MPKKIGVRVRVRVTLLDAEANEREKLSCNLSLRSYSLSSLNYDTIISSCSLQVMLHVFIFLEGISCWKFQTFEQLLGTNL